MACTDEPVFIWPRDDEAFRKSITFCKEKKRCQAQHTEIVESDEPEAFRVTNPEVDKIVKYGQRKCIRKQNPQEPDNDKDLRESRTARTG